MVMTVRKRLIVCFDGTGNAPEVVAGINGASNVLRLARSIQPASRRDGLPQMVEYIDGVATDVSAGPPGRLLAGIRGVGLSRIVQRGYEFLTNNYREGDHVFIFGYSRGAYAARSLSGLAELFGIIPKGQMHLFPTAWEFYNTRPDKRDCKALESRSAVLFHLAKQGMDYQEAHRREVKTGKEDEELRTARGAPFPGVPGEPFVEVGDGVSLDRVGFRPLPLHYLGLWDTVGKAAGEGFHEQRLAWNVHRAFQALAIHEVRKDFKPHFWSEWSPQQTVRQTWFAGAHADVGGGNGRADFSPISMDWMIEKARACHLDLDDPYVTCQPGHPAAPPVSMPRWDLERPRSVGSLMSSLKKNSTVLVYRVSGGESREFDPRRQFRHRSVAEYVETRVPHRHDSDMLDAAEEEARRLPLEPVEECAAFLRVKLQRVREARDKAQALLEELEACCREAGAENDLDRVRSIESDFRARQSAFGKWVREARRGVCDARGARNRAEAEPERELEPAAWECVEALAAEFTDCAAELGTLDACAEQASNCISNRWITVFLAAKPPFRLGP